MVTPDLDTAVLPKPVNVLFLHARNYLTPDLAVHYSLMAAFAPETTKSFVVSNSQARDVECHRAANAANSHLTSCLLPLGASLMDESSGFKQSLVASMASCLSALPRLLSLVRRHHIHIIHSTDRPRDIFLATLLAKAAHLPNVIHLHTNAAAYQNRAVLWGFRHATAFLAVSDFIRQEGLDLALPSERLYTVPNATDSVYFDPAPFREKKTVMRQELRSRFGLPDGAILVGIVARVIEWKGQKELIEAMASLILDHPNLYLLIVGGHDAPRDFTDYETRLAERARELNVADHIIFAGRIQDVRPVLAALDVFALPSYEEPFGLAITEAMAMELPVVACCSGGVPEIIENCQTGCLVEPRSAAAIAETLRSLLENPERSRQMGRAARQRVLEAYAPKKIAQSVSAIYQTVLAEYH